MRKIIDLCKEVPLLPIVILAAIPLALIPSWRPWGHIPSAFDPGVGEWIVILGAMRVVDRLLHRAESFGIGCGVSAGHAGQCDDVRLLRRGFDECGQVAARLGLRVGLDGVARRHHERDGPSRPILLHRHGGGERHDRE